MISRTQTNDTICAICTASGGALGIIRVSGPQAIAYTDTLFKAQSGRKLQDIPAGRVIFGSFIEEDGSVIDEVLVSLFRAPHSYTGEETVEVSCHASPYILQSIIQKFIHAGCRQALPGEYTQRAFLNGKMDLAQAEAVADLIASSSALAHRVAMRQMKGDVSAELSRLRDRLLHLTTLLELELDFSDHEDLEFASRDELEQVAEECEQHISRLCETFRAGDAVKRGVPIVLVGETNAGKSTWLNALVGEERAIVSNIQGTTRDAIEATIHLNGVTCRFIDTAGLRDTQDEIERLGIALTLKKAASAQIILWVIDATHLEEQIRNLSSRIIPLLSADSRLLIVINKADLIHEIPTYVQQLSVQISSLLQALPQESHTNSSFTCLPTSADTENGTSTDISFLPLGKALLLSGHNQEDISRLKSAIGDMLPRFSGDMTVITSARHYEALLHALSSIRQVRASLSLSISADLISADLRACISHLSEITGAITSTEVLNTVFSKFCIGK